MTAAGRAPHHRATGAGGTAVDGGGERAAVTLEAVLAAPVVALLATGVLGLVAVATDQLVAERVARSVARSVAVTGAHGDAAAALPAGGRVVVTRRGRSVGVEVAVPGAVLGIGYEARAVAVAGVEPAVP